jgi:hypothetical protein
MGKNQDPGSGINIPDPQDCLLAIIISGLLVCIHILIFCNLSFTTGSEPLHIYSNIFLLRSF